jgi:hypothetical protein
MLVFDEMLAFQESSFFSQKRMDTLFETKQLSRKVKLYEFSEF